MLYRKVILAIADGLGDRPHPLLNDITPLEYAHTPNLDQLAAGGITGMMDLIGPGISVGTDMGHLILFGYEPRHYPGRGPIEALGIGIDRRAGRIREKTDELARALDGLKLEDDNEPFEKAKAIELFDLMVGLIAKKLPDNVYLALAAGHSTPCEIGEHTGDPVPVAIYGPGIRRDRIALYNELDCAHGGLGRMSGGEFTRTLHGLMGYVKKQGN